VAKNTPDYDNDGMITSADREYVSWDKNKDGKIDAKERKAATTGTPGTQVSQTDAAGNTTTKIVGGRKPKETPKSPSDFGFNKSILDTYPDLLPLINQAIDQEWDDTKFLDELDMSEFGQARTRAQEQFDLTIADPRKAMDLNKQIEDQVRQFKADVETRGIQVADDELRNFAKETIRSGLNTNDALLFFSSKFKVGAEPVVGQAGTIMTDLQEMARSFGVDVDAYSIQSKVQEGLRQGSNYSVWLDGQKNIYRRQAKNLHPTIADQLDEFSYTELVDPYMTDAANVLGLTKAQMNTLDPMWGTALNGPNGPMSRDEWMRTLKTDGKYGYDRTVNARREAAQLGDELLAAFGMA
jgi:hypothetical protein